MWEQKLVDSVFDSSSEPIFVTERRTRAIISCNAATESLFGWSRAELSGQPSQTLTADAEHWQDLWTLHGAALEAGGVADFTMTGRHRDGHTFPVRVRCKLFQHDDASYTVIYVQDLTAVEKTANALAERVKELHCVYGVLDALSQIELPLAQRLAKLPAIVKAAWQFPDHTHIAITLRDLELSTEGYTPGVARQRGTIRAKGNEVGTITVAYDSEHPAEHEGPFLKEERDLLEAIAQRIGEAVEREDIEDARRRTEARLRFLSESLPLSIAIADWNTGEFLYANARARLELGVSELAQLGSLVLGQFYVNQEDRVAIRAELEREGTVKGRVIQIDIGGQTLWHSIYAELIDFEGRRAVYVIRSDVTDQRIAEEAARRSQQLQTIGQLATGVAHDFNNLLTALSMHLEMLREDQQELGIEDNRSVELVASVVERGASLTRQLLSFARQRVHQALPLEAALLLAQLRPFLARTLGARVQVGLSHAEDEFWISADKGLLESAILNLAINARDAMPDGGGITISIAGYRVDADGSARPGAVPGDYVEIAVADTGTGMEPDVLARVFEPFFTTKEAGRGTGLGLSMVNGFVQQSGGFVAIDSTVSVGTTVRLYLPRVAAGVAAGALAARDITGRESLLLIDDDDMVRVPLARSLAALGYRVAEAQNAPAASQALAQSLPDLVVTDVMMPGALGTEFVRELHGRYPDLPVLVISGSGIEKWLALPAARSDFCAKPFRLQELGVKIRALLENRPPP